MRSLRARLVVAFVAIISLTLLLVGIGLIFVLRQYQEQRELLRLGTLASPVSFQVRAFEQQGATAAEIVDLLGRQADDLDVRIVLANAQGAIFHDTESALVGQRISLQGAQRIGTLRRGRLAGLQGQEDGPLLFVVTGPSPAGSPLAESFLGRPSAYVVALVSEPMTVRAVLREMAPRLFLPALVSLLASIGVATVLAASIARPLGRMTRAAEEIARGRYEQELSSRGPEEIGRLAAALDTMAHAVARSQRTLRDFVANVSHDLRTPLTSIQGFSQAMVDGAIRDGDAYARAGRIINEEAERMRRLVEDLLELSKIESGEVALDLAPIDLAALVRGIGGHRRAAVERGISVTYHEQAAPIVCADGGRLERVFANLLDNAVKHGRPGADVTVTIAEELARDGRAVVTVHNVGSPIPPEDAPRIFERFYRVDKSRSGSAEGSGLGLAIAREIVQAHGGQIEVTSDGDGTSFTVSLPALDRSSERGIASAARGGGTPAADRVTA